MTPAGPAEDPVEEPLDEPVEEAAGAASGDPSIKPPEDVPPISAEDLVDGDHPEEHPDGALQGETEERRYPSTIGGAFYLLVLALTITGIGIVVAGSWRSGVRVMGGALIFAAAVRLLLAPRDAGMLAVRNKAFDASVLTALGAALIFLASSIPDQPGP